MSPETAGRGKQGPKKRIAVVIPQYGLVGGAEGFASELTRRLAETGNFDIHVLANRWRSCGSPVTFHHIPMVRFPRWAKPLSFAAGVRGAVGAGRFDLVHSHDRIFAMDLFTFHGIPHETWVRRARKKSMNLFDQATAWVERKGLKNPRLKAVLPVSELVRQELLAVYPDLGPRTWVCHPGVDARRFSPEGREDRRRHVRQAFGFEPGDVVVLFVGMNFEIKRLGLVMRGIGGLDAAERGRVRLLVVGKGNLRRYRGLAHGLGIGPRVVFTGATGQVADCYLAADIFAMPSHFDTFGLTVLEAMASGLPVIVSSRVGAKDLVQPGTSGLVLSADPLDREMTAALHALVAAANPTDMGRNALRIAVGCSWNRTADQVAGFYRRLTDP